MIIISVVLYISCMKILLVNVNAGSRFVFQQVFKTIGFPVEYAMVNDYAGVASKIDEGHRYDFVFFQVENYTPSTTSLIAKLTIYLKQRMIRLVVFSNAEDIHALINRDASARPGPRDVIYKPAFPGRFTDILSFKN